MMAEDSQEIKHWVSATKDWLDWCLISSSSVPGVSDVINFYICFLPSFAHYKEIVISKTLLSLRSNPSAMTVVRVLQHLHRFEDNTLPADHGLVQFFIFSIPFNQHFDWFPLCAVPLSDRTSHCNSNFSRIACSIWNSRLTRWTAAEFDCSLQRVAFSLVNEIRNWEESTWNSENNSSLSIVTPTFKLMLSSQFYKDEKARFFRRDTTDKAMQSWASSQCHENTLVPSYHSKDVLWRIKCYIVMTHLWSLLSQLHMQE